MWYWTSKRNVIFSQCLALKHSKSCKGKSIRIKERQNEIAFNCNKKCKCNKIGKKTSNKNSIV